jgi:hypothetical protein
MRPKTEKVVDPESIAWVERREGRRGDEGYFASAWQRALPDAESDLKRRTERHQPGPPPARGRRPRGAADPR